MEGERRRTKSRDGVDGSRHRSSSRDDDRRTKKPSSSSAHSSSREPRPDRGSSTREHRSTTRSSSRDPERERNRDRDRDRDKHRSRSKEPRPDRPPDRRCKPSSSSRGSDGDKRKQTKPPSRSRSADPPFEANFDAPSFEVAAVSEDEGRYRYARNRRRASIATSGPIVAAPDGGPVGAHISASSVRHAPAFSGGRSVGDGTVDSGGYSSADGGAGGRRAGGRRTGRRASALGSSMDYKAANDFGMQRQQSNPGLVGPGAGMSQQKSNPGFNRSYDRSGGHDGPGYGYGSPDKSNYGYDDYGYGSNDSDYGYEDQRGPPKQYDLKGRATRRSSVGMLVSDFKSGADISGPKAPAPKSAAPSLSTDAMVVPMAAPEKKRNRRASLIGAVSAVSATVGLTKNKDKEKEEARRRAPARQGSRDSDDNLGLGRERRRPGTASSGVATSFADRI